MPANRNHARAFTKASTCPYCPQKLLYQNLACFRVLKTLGKTPGCITRSRHDTIAVPGATLVCGGWILADALDVMAAGLADLNARDDRP